MKRLSFKIFYCSVVLASLWSSFTTASIVIDPTGVYYENALFQAELNYLNTASPEDLRTIEGIDIPKAKAIVNYRAQYGDFNDVADLKKVPGFDVMDKKTFQGIIKQLG